MNVAEVAPDGRQRVRENGLVERAHEGGQEDAENDQPRLAVSEQVGSGPLAVGISPLDVGIHRNFGLSVLHGAAIRELNGGHTGRSL